MYEQQMPFELLDYVALTHFLNHFLYKSIQDSLFGQYNFIESRLLYYEVDE